METMQSYPPFFYRPFFLTKKPPTKNEKQFLILSTTTTTTTKRIFFSLEFVLVFSTLKAHSTLQKITTKLKLTYTLLSKHAILHMDPGIVMSIIYIYIYIYTIPILHFSPYYYSVYNNIPFKKKFSPLFFFIYSFLFIPLLLVLFLSSVL